MKAVLIAAGFVAALAGTARAEFPERPITWIVPFGAGGVTDINSRRLAERLSREIGQSVIVENKPGAGGIVGTKEGQMATPDGYTVVFATSGPVGIQPGLDPSRLPYDALSDFTFIHGVSLSPQMITANINAPFNTIEELVAYAKANPGKLNYGSPGIGTAQHLGGELFEKATGIDMAHIPYTSGATQMVDLAAGVIDLSFEYYPIVTPYVEEGKMKILGSTGIERSAAVNQVPTVVEAGYPEAVNLGWTLLAAPKGLPEAVQTRLTEAMHQVMQDPTIIAETEADGRAVLQLKGHDDVHAFVESQIEKFRSVGEGVALK